MGETLITHLFLKEEIIMPLKKINIKLTFVLLLIFFASMLYIFNTNGNCIYPQKSFENINNSSINIDVHSGDSIQQAIDNVCSGGTVTVYSGLYKENLAIDKPLSIISKERKHENAIIQAADPERDVFKITANNVTVSGFNITGSQNKSGIYCSGSGCNITGNKLSYNMYGIYINNSNRNTQDNNEINDNFFGIYLNNSTNNQVSNNNFSCFGLIAKLDNGGGGIGGICLEDSNNNRLINNTILKYWEGINLTNSSNNELNNNSILDNYFSLSLINSNNNKVLNNIIVKGGYSFSVIIYHSQNNTLQGNTGGLNTEIKVTYGFNSTNNTLEGEIDNADEPITPKIGSEDFWV
ncbi:hypothetical protein DU86_11880 [Methanosarcina mazei]|jgi:parallel beta-helix repeat protein|nr:right-handed parallel beta-helix repeat-containing protein [Methanosarcina mazei]KKG01528.1 hypothetical protein DU40_04480 [Methanosarcina mazei]KKG06067.1 hypothetical protein DU31_11160 [Methanosarcina mazei]KKG16373.1 hypothetical protein DU34_05790 [Methanosarcina mazei]KKG28153.1 hypothetical protein DU49_06710 [Methanosarcina mazei]KKG36027.1 hypothetical protein DU52_03645 [Methanosarcina mazei]